MAIATGGTHAMITHHHHLIQEIGHIFLKKNTYTYMDFSYENTQDFIYRVVDDSVVDRLQR